MARVLAKSGLEIEKVQQVVGQVFLAGLKPLPSDSSLRLARII